MTDNECRIAASKREQYSKPEYRVEVLADSSGKWAGNGLTFDSVADAVYYARDLASRWTLVTAWRVLNVRGQVVERQGGI